MSTPAAEILAEVLSHALDGVAIVEQADGVPRLRYANATLAALLRRPEEWLEGRALEEIEAEADAPADPNATVNGVGLRSRLRRSDATMVECERWAVLLSDGRLALYYRPLPRTAPGALAAAVDRSSGLSTPEHLLETLRRDWSIAQRDGRALTVMRFDLDAYRDYHDVFGRGVTENVLRQVGRTIASAMRRASDVVARVGDDEFLVLGVSMDQEAAFHYAENILGRIRALAIHHPRSRTSRFMTASAGVVTAVAPRDAACEVLLDATQKALAEAKKAGGNRVVRGEIEKRK